MEGILIKKFNHCGDLKCYTNLTIWNGGKSLSIVFFFKADAQGNNLRKQQRNNDELQDRITVYHQWIMIFLHSQ
jgi:hypothetical protein